MTIKILKNPLSEEALEKLLDDGVMIRACEFRGLNTRGYEAFNLEAPFCLVYYVRKLSSSVQMYRMTHVIDAPPRHIGENVTADFFNTLSMLNGLIKESKTDKTIVVYTESNENMKGKRTRTPAKKPATRKPATRRPARK